LSECAFCLYSSSSSLCVLGRIQIRPPFPPYTEQPEPPLPSFEFNKENPTRFLLPPSVDWMDPSSIHANLMQILRTVRAGLV